MADNKIVHAEGTYKVQNVGPSKPWDSQYGQMMTYSIQFEGIADWIDLSQKADTDAPKQGDTFEGHVEDTGKYGLKFKKASKGGFGGGGGGKFSAGAAWANSIQTAAAVVAGYLSVNPEAAKKAATIGDYFGLVSQVAPKVKAFVDQQAGNDKPAADTKTESESGVSPGAAPAAAPAPQAEVNTDGAVNVDTGSDPLGGW